MAINSFLVARLTAKLPTSTERSGDRRKPGFASSGPRKEIPLGGSPTNVYTIRRKCLMQYIGSIV
jgi:hypothetical protein